MKNPGKWVVNGTRVWQGSAGDRRPYADQDRLCCPTAGNPVPQARKTRFWRAEGPQAQPLKENRLHKWVADGKRRRIDIKPLVTGVVVSPWANSRAYKEREGQHDLGEDAGEA